MAKPKLTIGMATFQDYYGVAMTIQSIKRYLRGVRDVELLVVDQDPNGTHGPHVKNLIAGFGQYGTAGARYVPYTERIGTSASRDKVIEEAAADTVIIMDCHILPHRNTIPRVLEYFSDPTHAKDIFSAPMLTDAIWRRIVDVEADNGEGEHTLQLETPSIYATHYADHWRAEMHGTWSTAWQCPCKEFFFATWEEDGLVKYEAVTMQPERYEACPKCGKKFPLLHWPGHEAQLETRGFTNYAEHGTDIFEIPGQGLGFFAVKKEHWPGFNKFTWGFGGEELWIHDLIRAKGGKAVCDPTIPWWHRFGRPEGPSYPNSLWYKCRNYMLEFAQIGYDLEPIRQHFVVNGRLKIGEWEAMLADPINRVHGPSDEFKQPLMQGGKPVPNSSKEALLEDIFTEVRTTKRDLNQHVAYLREFVSRHCLHVTEFSKRNESAVCWLAALANKSGSRLVSFNTELNSSRLKKALEIVKKTFDTAVTEKQDPLPLSFNCFPNQSSEVESLVEDTDFIWFDTVMHADRLRHELLKFASKSRRFIAIRGTGSYGVTAEGGGPGLWEAVIEFITHNPEWFVHYHTNTQYGFTILSKNEEDRPEKEIIPWPPMEGPGQELKKILNSVGVYEKPGCTCTKMRIRMNILGVEGCRREYDDIIEKIEANAAQWGFDWKDPVKTAENIVASTRAATNVIWQKLFNSASPAAKIDWSDPKKRIPQLVSLSIELAEAKEKELPKLLKTIEDARK